VGDVSSPGWLQAQRRVEHFPRSGGPVVALPRFNERSGLSPEMKRTEMMKKLASITLVLATIFVLAALFSAPLMALLAH